MSFYEGVQKTLNPHVATNVYINYLVLGAAIIFEGAAWYVAFKEFKRVFIEIQSRQGHARNENGP